MAGGAHLKFSSNIYYKDGHEIWGHSNSSDIEYSITLINNEEKGDYQACADIVIALMAIEKNNEWCNAAHHGECSFVNVYQPKLPPQSAIYGEFLAVEHYYYTFQFLQIPSRSSLQTLEYATKKLCSMSKGELDKFNNDRISEEDAVKMCFRATYVLQILHKGHGFRMKDIITAADIVNGQVYYFDSYGSHPEKRVTNLLEKFSNYYES